MARIFCLGRIWMWHECMVPHQKKNRKCTLVTAYRSSELHTAPRMTAKHAAPFRTTISVQFTSITDSVIRCFLTTRSISPFKNLYKQIFTGYLSSSIPVMELRNSRKHAKQDLNKIKPITLL